MVDFKNTKVRSHTRRVNGKRVTVRRHARNVKKNNPTPRIDHQRKIELIDVSVSPTFRNVRVRLRIGKDVKFSRAESFAKRKARATLKEEEGVNVQKLSVLNTSSFGGVFTAELFVEQKATTPQFKGWVVKKDGVARGVAMDKNNALMLLQDLQPNSVDHAVRFEGWSVERAR